MSHKRNLTIVLLVSAVAGAVIYQRASAPRNSATATVEILSSQTPSLEAPTPTPTYESCSYIWASHDAPELSEKLNQALQKLNSAASANAQFFGEDCVYADGRSTFSAMEVDFYIRLPAEDLNATAEFGDWIKQVMDTIAALPQAELGARKGYAEFSFIKSAAERIVVRVPIEAYQSLDPTLSGAELFAKFYAPIAPTP
ncbi:MAG: hypothetical protein IT311_00020 [Anaerolineales bacterium]|nr:hypothetical protein [Anaerolineales bacterium]MCZ2120736.1 hypothetical protein [Anaerolineales bacterium]